MIVCLLACVSEFSTYCALEPEEIGLLLEVFALRDKEVSVKFVLEILFIFEELVQIHYGGCALLEKDVTEEQAIPALVVFQCDAGFRQFEQKN